MLTFSDSQAMSVLQSGLWPFLRISSFALTAPILGTRAVPRRIRLMFALLLTMVMAPLVVLDPQVAATEVLSGAGIAVALQQVLIGSALGLILRTVFVVLEFAGQVIAQQMGLGFAAMVDPQSGMQVPVISQFYVVLATLFFFATDTHLHLIQLLVDSFTIVPVGTTIPREAYAGVMNWSGDLIGLAVVISMPILVALLIVNISFAVMARAAPQLNIFAVGFPVTILFGVVMMTLMQGALHSELNQTFDSAFTAAYQFLGAR
ncbi:MAG: flagellar biosynthetic protein FliR [Gammaproteobacteria bacterium]|nr:flagellar biosynthetic protein FliR [Gammaproteobacteria bacterium]